VLVRAFQAKQKSEAFLSGEVFFNLTCPLMGDPIFHKRGG